MKKFLALAFGPAMALAWSTCTLTLQQNITFCGQGASTSGKFSLTAQNGSLLIEDSHPFILPEDQLFAISGTPLLVSSIFAIGAQGGSFRECKYAITTEGYGATYGEIDALVVSNPQPNCTETASTCVFADVDCDF